MHYLYYKSIQMQLIQSILVPSILYTLSIKYIILYQTY